MTKSIAALLSTIGHPFLLMPLVLTLLTLRQLPFAEAWPTLAAVFGGLALLGLFLFFRKRKGKISNWDVSAQSERARNVYRPILILVVAAAAVLWFFRQPFVGDTLYFGLMMAICYAINVRVKISQHTLIAAYLSFLALPASMWAGIGLMGFTPFIAWSRVVLGRHQPHEVLLGGIVGAAFGLLHIWLM